MDKLNVPFEIAQLIFRQLKNKLSPEEEICLQNWINENSSNKQLYERIKDEQYIEGKIKRLESYDKKAAWLNIIRKTDQSVPVRQIIVRRLIPYAAILIPAMIVGYLLFYMPSNRTGTIADTEIIVPGTQKAVLTLANRKKIELTNDRAKTILTEKQVHILDTVNSLKYIAENIWDDKSKSLKFNTLETPRGGEYKIELVDGTIIWLNAASKLRYPIVFYGDERRVYLEGEAYFKVAKNMEKPFFVCTGDMEVMVMGTAFNVMSYHDEESIQTTLVEGKVRVKTGNSGNTRSSLDIVPGEQAVYTKEKNTLISKKVDTDVYTDWKDGKFIITHEPLDKLMRRLERWYNFETEYVDPDIRRYHFSGTLNRYDQIFDILDMIALTTHISFEIQNHKVIATKEITK